MRRRVKSDGSLNGGAAAHARTAATGIKKEKDKLRHADEVLVSFADQSCRPIVLPPPHHRHTHPHTHPSFRHDTHTASKTCFVARGSFWLVPAVAVALFMALQAPPHNQSGTLLVALRRSQTTGLSK